MTNAFSRIKKGLSEGDAFAMDSLGIAGKDAFIFKTSVANFDFLSGHPGYQPVSYLASRGMKWMQQYDAPASEDKELVYYIEESHRIVSLGVSKKKQKELGLNQETN